MPCVHCLHCQQIEKNKQAFKGPFEFNENLFKKISDLGLSKKAWLALYRVNIKYVGDLVRLKSRYELLKVPNVGTRTANEIIEALNSVQLDLGIQLDESFPTHEELEVRCQ